MEKTFFIAFEGLDGCGKDTQLYELVKTIKELDSFKIGNKYSNIWVTREPTKITKSGVEISNLLLGSEEVSGEITSKLYTQDRIEHSKIIKETLKHSHVLTSRYDLSTLLYQSVQGIAFEKLYEMHKYGQEDGALIPDITIVFDLPIEVAFERMSSRTHATEFFEKKEFQEKLKKELDSIINKISKNDGRKIIRVNANQSIDNVTKEMIDKINNFL